tara:strand:- start:766 stop:1986 length:1221 start_codon:yes stop_codon:yes gene_type:complete
MRNEGYLLFLGAGRWQCYGIKCARQLGIRTIAVDANPDAIGFDHSDKVINIDFHKNEDSVITALEKYNFYLRGVISYCNEKGMRLASKIRGMYGLAGIDEKITENMVNKYHQRKKWTKHNLPCPKWKLIESLVLDIKKIDDGLSYPLIIKPIDSSGSRGVIKINERDELSTGLTYAQKFSADGRLIIEEYFDGDEYTVESITINNVTTILTVTKKAKVLNTQNTVANQLESINTHDELYLILSKLAINALSALGYDNGPGHTEILHNKVTNKIILVETAGRGAGFKVFESLVPKVSGYNFTNATLFQAIKEKFEAPVQISNNYGIIKYFTGKKGTVVSIKGFEKIKNFHNNKISIEGSPFVNLGEKLETPSTDGDRLGYLMGWGKRRSDVFDIFIDHFEKISFEIQ